MKFKLIDFIPEGEENAISANELAKLLQCHRRDITLAINGLRCGGEVICSNHRGYYRPTCVQDVMRTYRHMTSRQNEIEKAKQSAKIFIQDHGGDVDAR